MGLSWGSLGAPLGLPGALMGLSWGSIGALLGQSWGLLGHASDPLGLMSSPWPLLATFLGQTLPVWAPILVTFLICFWVTFWIVFWVYCLNAFWGQKLPRRRQGEAHRRHKVAFLLLFTMVSACCLFCCFQVLGLLLVPFWCQLGLLKRPSGPQNGCQNLSKTGPKMGSKNDRHLGGSLGGVLGPRVRAHGQQPAENEAWGGVGEGLKTLPRGLGIGSV